MLLAMPLFLVVLFLANVYLRRMGADPDELASPSRVLVAAPESVSESECRELADQWTKAALSGNADAFESLIDFDEIGRRASAGVPVDDRGLAASMKGFKLNFVSQFKDIPNQTGKRGSYRLVGIRQRDGTHRVLIRLVSEDSTINYHDLLVQRRPGGPPKVTDIDIAASGEPVTVTLHRYLVPVARRSGQRTTAEQEHVDSIGRMTEMAQLQAKGQHAQVLDCYRLLPKSRQREKIALIARLRSATLVNREEHESALRDLRKFHAGDPCLALASMDFHLRYGDHQQLLDAVNELDRVVGGDPYLDVMRISALFGLKKDDDALSALAAVSSWDDSHYQVQYILLLTSIVSGQFENTDRHLTILQQNFGFQLSEFESRPEFAEFVARESYQAWKKSRRDR
ncbi:MAG TPA: hypothetical protein VMP01_07555 [Pirellulaceae bacterium]|nr:hypothetical protein [Pirellulaceae bacterium]